MDARVTLHSILSPVDFSEQSRDALRWAQLFAARCHSRLTVLSVVNPLLAKAARIRFDQDLAQSTEPELRAFVAAAFPNDGELLSQTIVQVRIGDPAEIILAIATNDAVGLIVLGTQGVGGFRKWILGSTTERVLRRTHIPVLAVPPVDEKANARNSRNQSIEVGRILVATDFSEPRETAVQFAAMLAQEFAVPLVLAHVVSPMTVPPQWRLLAEESDEQGVADATRRLKQLAEKFTGSQNRDTVVSVGQPAEAIGSIAEERRATLIVMGLTGKRQAYSPRPGSIAYHVLSSARIPVLVVPRFEQ